MKTKLLLLGALLVQWGGALAAWDDSYDPMAASSYPDDAVLNFEEPLGVDPIYSTPSEVTASPSGQRPFVPNDVYWEYMGKMSICGQHARTQITNVFLALPLTNPQRMSWGRWHLDAGLRGRVTWIDTSGRDVIDEDVLYTLGLQAALSYQMANHKQFQLGFTPQLSSDLDVMSSENFYWGGYAAFSAKPSDRLGYTVGLALMPDYYDHYVFPVVNLNWRYSPVWELRVQASRISLANVASERFQWGPFFQWNSGIWTVRRHRQTQQLRMTNCIAGMGASYDAKWGNGMVLHFIGDLGTAFYNAFRVRDKHGDHTWEKYRTHPGWYARLGLQVQF